VTAVCPGRSHPALGKAAAERNTDDEAESAADDSSGSAAGRIHVVEQVELKEIRGSESVESVLVADRETGEETVIEADGVFFQLTDNPNSDIARSAGVKVDEEGYIVTDARGRTNIEGIYAVGDVTAGPLKMVVAALAQASAAAADIYQSLTGRQ